VLPVGSYVGTREPQYQYNLRSASPSFPSRPETAQLGAIHHSNAPLQRHNGTRRAAYARQFNNRIPRPSMPPSRSIANQWELLNVEGVRRLCIPCQLSEHSCVVRPTR
jgi:hypothetical protein